jgi:hypothetical protein
MDIIIEIGGKRYMNQFMNDLPDNVMLNKVITGCCGTTVDLSNDLVLVDGIVYKNSLDSINVQEIESVTVSKNGSATDLYGKAGEDGVNLITTKKEAIKRKP